MTCTAVTTANFIEQVKAKCPFRIQTILTDNGKEFTDRFTSNGERQPTGAHRFDQTCRRHGIEHRLIRPKHPQTNGMVERFQVRISNILKTTYFQTGDEMRATLYDYLKVYNERIVQRALGHLTPVEKMEQWEKEKPELFVRTVDNHTGLDSDMGSIGCHHARRNQKLKRKHLSTTK